MDEETIHFGSYRDCGYGAQPGRMRRQGHEHLGAVTPTDTAIKKQKNS